MQIPSLPRRNLVFVIALLVLLLIVLHLQRASVLGPNEFDGIQSIPEFETVETPVTEEQEQPPEAVEVAVPPHSDEKLIEEPQVPTACDNVDFAWLASDRVYWDGWVSKAMFMRQDGNFTTKHVFISEGDSVCVVVLLGPAPAKSAIKPEEHLAPADSIVMTAVGKSVKQTIELMQHQKQTNVYYASVTFPYEGTYYLDTRTEYRSYFWEEPVLHQYRPNRFTSQNKLAVRSRANAPKSTLPPCDFSKPEHNYGGWMKKAEYQRLFPLDFFGMFGVSQEDHAENNRLYIPSECRPQYVSVGQATECLKHKTVHVWADGNVRRNLKAFSSGNRWCTDLESSCVCNDDDEDPEGTLYPWASDPNVPLVINETWNADTSIYFNPVGSINLKNYKEIISERVQTAPQADIVILGFGNEDIRNRDVSPTHFASLFFDLLSYLRTSVYPTQTIIVRTPQPFCCGTIYSTSWNAGRSAAFTRAVMDGVAKLNQSGQKVLLWDVHQLGLPDHMCVLSGTAYTKRNVVNIENLLLWNLICGTESYSSSSISS